MPKANYICRGQILVKREARNTDSFLPLTPIAFEILLAVADEPRHGYDIMVAIERRTGGRMSPNPGTLYRALDRLARERLLEISENRAGSAGEVKKIFRLSRLGRVVVAAEAERLADQVGAARRLLGKARGAS